LPQVKINVDKAHLFSQVGYEPMPHQNLFHNSKARFRCAVCGRRAGKTNMVGNDRIAELLKPPSHGTQRLGWIVGPTYDLAAKEFRVMWDSLIIGMGLGGNKQVKANFNIKQGDMYIEVLPSRSRVEVRSAAHPETLVGDGLDWVIMSEAAKQTEETWQKYVRPALSDKRGTADFVTTPEGKNWLYALWKKGRKGKSHIAEWESWRFPSWVNSIMFPGGRQDEEILSVEADTLEEWFLQEYAAEFTAVVGRILGQFAQEDHVLNDYYQFNPDWPNYICFDWGYTAPLAAMEFQVSPRDEVYVWREHYFSNRTLEWHIETIKGRVNPDGYRLDLAFGDAADPEAVEYVTDHLVECIADPDSKDWLTGIRLMQSHMKLHHDGISYDANGVPIMRPRYFVDPSCENHIDEVENYRARKGAASTMNEFTGARVVDPKCQDHSLDAVRYGMMHKFKVVIAGNLSDVYPEWAKTRRETIEVSPQKVLAATIPRQRNQTFFNFKNITPGGRF
jgi:hypothetical protein